MNLFALIRVVFQQAGCQNRDFVLYYLDIYLLDQLTRRPLQQAYVGECKVLRQKFWQGQGQF